jgi:polysaccharide pyruvyl transferase WcaK-like protein
MNASHEQGSLCRVFQTGTFDVQNYGDLLFPLLASFRLRPWNIEVLPVSPTGLPVGWEGAAASRRLTDMLNMRETVHGVLIGGGNIVHAGPANLRDYEMGDLYDWAYAGLWFGATLAAAMRNVPVAWNAPGVPRPVLTPANTLYMEAALRAADYLSVRDSASAEHLRADRVDCRLVPDTAIDLARMWPRASLADPFRSLLDRKQAPQDARYLAVNIRERSLDNDHAAVADGLATLADGYGLTPLLVAVGPCHNDHTTARHIARCLRRDHVLLDDPIGPIEITAAIAGAALYIGASLHGYIASAAYGVPGILVALPELPKFTGFLRQIGRLADLAGDWSEAFAIGARHLAEAQRPRIPDDVHDVLDRHWEQIAHTFLKPAQKMADRTRFLRLYAEAGTRSLGPDWLLSPLLGRRSRARFDAPQGGTRPE